MELVEVELPWLSTKLAEYLCTENRVKALDIDGTLNVREGMAYIAVNSATKEAALQEFRSLIGACDYPFLKMHEIFLKSSKWEDLVERVERQFLVVITVIAPERKICVSEVDVNLAWQEISTELRRYATAVSVPVTPGEGRYMKEHDTFLENLESVKIDIVENGQWMITVSGHENDTTPAKFQIRKRVESLQKDRKTISRAGCRAVFSSNSGKSALRKIEKRHTCIIEIETDANSSPNLPSMGSTVRPGNLDSLESTNDELLLFCRGRVSLFLVRGDITEYKADVLVNTLVARSKTFRRAGSVANAFLTRGGQKLEQTSVETAKQ